MPRKPPKRLRRPDHGPAPQPQIDGLSARTHAAIRYVEDVHYWPGAVARALAGYQYLLREPGRWLPGDPVISPGLEPEADRSALQDMMAKLPPEPRRELELLLAPLDDDYMRRTLPEPGENPTPDQRWRWRDREV
ncbi:hypothetical protein [Actinoplanes friuliensis]|uniref:Uncharacterized protein n=1 Tax=Actinoplanes friuliensis DSM 7358 TaxID=1246995 RepID=U5VV04_9ACTN|nr:hypothetical protein [Actinoplanes friuliensis]AGZ40622.1 hypothetical protein AFR_11665 [Actinoplanes friuliensis DSM 7358]